MLQLNDPTLLRTQSYVKGSWHDSSDGRTMPVTNPATGEVLAEVACFTGAELDTIIEYSEAAQRDWAARTAKDRAGILQTWFRMIVENADDVARIMTAEQGKPLAEARGEVLYAASFIEWFAEEAKRVYGETIPAPQVNQRITVLRQPVGVTAAITPWNFPAAMITRKAAPALAAGCSMIVRPADLTPLTALALGVLAERAGVPAGVLQIVTGEAVSIGRALTDSTIVRKLSFTGSTEVGRLLMAQCAPTIKKMSLELGGNAPFIVFDDAELDAAVEGAMISKFRNAGQTCVCANRILVQAGVYDAFAEKLAARVATLKVANGTEAGADIGPLIEEKSLAKVEAHIRDAQGKGATLLQGGERLGGLFISPAVLSGVTTDMQIAHEETFGPVAPLFRFETEEDAVRMANDTIFGLAAYFYTRDHGRMVRVSEKLEYGMVGHNTGLISNEVAPFGGVKQSGLGREGSHHGIDDYLELKYICSVV